MATLAAKRRRDPGLPADLEDESFGKAYNHKVVIRFIGYIMPYKKLVAIAFAAMLIYTATNVAVPWIIKVGIDSYIAADDFSGLKWIFAIFIGNILLFRAANFAWEVSLAYAGQNLLNKLRADMFAHLQKLSVSFYDKTEVGRLMSRVLGDVGQLQEFLNVVVVTMADLLSLVGIIVAVLLINVELGLITMAVLPILVVIMAFWQPFAKKSFVRARRAIAIVNGALNENITGVRVVQAMNRQERNLEVFDGKNTENFDATLYASRLSAGLLPLVDILTGLSIGLIIIFGAQMVSNQALQVGALVAFILYIQRFFDPIRSLTMQYTQLQRSMASGTRIFELMDTEPEVKDCPDARPLPRVKGKVEFRNVSFAYVHNSDVLKNVSLTIEPGETVAIVGPTGSGKTTMISLLGRFYDVQRGRGAILVDGHDIRDVTRKSLAQQISVVLQEPFLFSGTVRENIKHNHTQVSDEQMIQAAKAVGAHDFIMSLESGYDTYLEERGWNLSMGQRQLISFARALVANPRIVILDEATASIDSYTEMLIQKALQKLLEGRTAIIIAHRLSTVRGADKIVVLRFGEVVEVGAHDQLMEREGLYAHLYKMNYAALEGSAAAPASPNGKQPTNGATRR